MSRILFYPYKLSSKSAKLLSVSLNTKRVKPFGRFRSKYYDIVINWGNTTIPNWYARIINKPEKVAIATDKLLTFRKLSECSVPTPDWTTEYEVALQWINEGSEVYARRLLRGNSGNGITVCTTASSLIQAPLYTKRVKAKAEYRVHVAFGEVIDFQQKKKRHDFDGSSRIRNHSNGYVFAREGVILPDSVREASINGVKALGLDFGAVDIGYVERHNKPYIYEINTAPGIENTTLRRYVDAFNQLRSSYVF